MSEETKTTSRGRPSGTGTRVISLADAAEIVGDSDEMIPVPYKWLEKFGLDPSQYDKWDRKGLKKPTSQQGKEESEQVEFTFTK